MASRETLPGARRATKLRPLAGLLLLAGLLGGTMAQAAVITVHSGEKIQAAIDRAAAGDEIHIERGRYVENLRVDRTLTLRGINRPTISGSNKGDTIRVIAPDVVIEGLIVTDSGDSLLKQNAGIYIQPGAHRAIVRNCFLSYNLFGLWIEKANDVQVLNNNITGKRNYDSAKRGNGVELYNTKGARIIGNEISFVRDALYIDVSHHAVFQRNRLHHSRYGTHYMNSYYNLWEDNDTWHNRGGLALMEVRDQTIRNNRAWKNSDHGIMLRTLQDSEVDGNWVANNGRGFFVYDVEYIKLRDNVVANNRIGVHLSGSPRNEVDGNDFVDNQQQVKYAGTRDLAWGGKKGNFWSNYRGWDRNDDGRGDIPYEANDMVDRLTWRYPGVRLLMASPAVQALRMVGQQFPILRVPSVVEQRPRMNPLAAEWAPWLAKTRNNLYNAPENLRDDVTLDVRPGEVFGLIGHNGAGKSTLFKIMLGLLAPTSGSIHIAGEPVGQASALQVRRRIGYLPENVALWDNLSGLETLKFFARLKGLDTAGCAALLTKVGLEHAGDRPVRAYSKGMRQRLGFAQALQGNPQVLFLDEPTTGLDPRAIHFFWDTLAELRDRGLTIVLTSHILAELQNRVDRVAVMANGRIQALGSLTELRAGFDLPLHMQIQLKPGTDAAAMLRWLQALPDELATLPVREHRATGSVVIDVPHRHKMRLLQHLLSAQEYVADIQVQEPSLEDMFFASPDDQAARNTPASAGTPDRQPTTPQTSTGGQA